MKINFSYIFINNDEKYGRKLGYYDIKRKCTQGNLCANLCLRKYAQEIY